MRTRIDYAGTWALVTGASSGIGEEFARRLAERGAHLVLAARSGERLQQISEDLKRVHGIEARPVAVDLADAAGRDELVHAVERMGIFVEHLVNDAGFGSAGPFASLDGAREAAMVRLNAEAVVALTRAFLEPMIQARRGGVINVASIAAFQPVPYMATYGATKAFVLSFTVALAAELRGTGVRATALCPGPVRTGFQRAAGITPGARLAELTAHQTVERGLAAYERGKPVCVPGFVNRLQHVATKVVPGRVLVWGAAEAMRRLGRAGTKPR